jgi:hypothetical protein
MKLHLAIHILQREYSDVDNAVTAAIKFESEGALPEPSRIVAPSLRRRGAIESYKAPHGILVPF